MPKSAAPWILYFANVARAILTGFFFIGRGFALCFRELPESSRSIHISDLPAILGFVVARAKLHKSRAINETPRRAGCGGPDTTAAAAKKSAIAVKGTERERVCGLSRFSGETCRSCCRSSIAAIFCGGRCGRKMPKAKREKVLGAGGGGEGERGGESAGLDEGCEASPRARLIAINNSPLLEYTTPCNEIMQIKRKF